MVAWAMTQSGKSDIPWGPRPRGHSVGARPTSKGIELMIGRPGEPTEFVPLMRWEAEQVRQAIAQALYDYELGIKHKIR
jgi:hypothetical protein